MKVWLVSGVIALAIGVTAVAIPLCDYRSPRMDLSDLSIGFSYHYYNDPYGLSDWDIDTGELEVAYNRLFESSEVGFELTAENNMTISVLSVSAFLATAEGSFKRYFSPEAPYFGFAGGSAESASSYQKMGLTGKLGVGYGRFRDVTPLAKAMKLDDYLFKQKSISAHLDAIDLETLAYEIDSIATYNSLGDLLGVLQEIIEGSGYVKGGGLDALDIYKIAQIIEDDRFTRYCGGDVKVGLGYEFMDPLGKTNDLLAEAVFNYAFTTTPREQFLVRGIFSSLSGAFDILRTHRIEAHLTYDYVLDEMINLVMAYDFERERWEDVPTDRHNLSFDLKWAPIENAAVALHTEFGHEPYFLEWSVDITLSISMVLL